MTSLAFPQFPALNETYTLGDRSWKWNGLGWEKLSAESTRPYIIVAFFPGPLDEGELLLQHEPVIPAQFPADMAGSKASAISGPQNDADILIELNGITVATIHWPAGEGQAVFLPSDSFTLDPTQGHILSVIAPSPADPWLDTVTISLKGSRS